MTVTGCLFPPFERDEEGNGLSVYWVPDLEQETLTIAIQFQFGRFADPRGMEGIGETLIALMQKGTVTHEHGVFSEMLERRGATLFAEVAEEHSVVGCRMLARYAGSVVPLFWEMVTSPGLREEELPMIKREVCAAMQAEYADPGAVAHRHYAALVFGTSSVAGRSRTPASVKRVTAHAVREHYRAVVTPAKSALILAGSLQIAAARSMWGPLFQAWEHTGNSSATAGAVVPASPVRGRTLVVVDKPELTQTTLLLGHQLPAEHSCDRTALSLVNYVFGGGNFSSRLMDRVRSQMGKTYGIGSQYITTASLGVFVVTTATRTEQTAGMLDVVLDECRTLCEQGMTDGELEKAQRYITGNMAFQFEGIGNIADKLLWLHHYNRPVSYLENYAAHVCSLTLDEVNGALRRHWDPGRILCVAVGSRAKLGATLNGFGQLQHRHFRSAAR